MRKGFLGQGDLLLGTAELESQRLTAAALASAAARDPSGVPRPRLKQRLCESKALHQLLGLLAVRGGSVGQEQEQSFCDGVRIGL